MTQLDAILPPDLVLNNQRLIRTRWLAGISELVAVVLSVRLLGLDLPELPLYALGLFILGYNILLRNASQNDTHTGHLQHIIRLQVVLDWLSMAVFVHLTGGVVSPALVFFFLHVIMVTILLPGQSPYLYVTAVMAGIVGLSVLEASDFLPHHTFLPDIPITLYTDPEFIVLRLVFFGVAMYAAAYITASVMRPLRRRERQITALFQTVQAISSTLELDAVLERLASTVCYALDVDGAAIRLLSRDRRSLELAASAGNGKYAIQQVNLHNTKTYQRVIKGESHILTGNDLQLECIEPMAQIGTVLLVPIKGKEMLGVLTVYAPESFDASPQVMRFARAIADEGAVAIQNALDHEALQRAEKQRTQFVRIVTHELRAPVTGAQSLLRVMLAQMAGDLNERQIDILQRLNKRMDSLLVLIGDLLSLAASKARDLQQPLEPVNLRTCLDQIIDDHRFPAQSKNITLTTKFDDQLPQIMGTDEGICRIFTNLVGNAIKYTPEGGNVHVELCADDSLVHVTVRDSGIGIPPDALDKLGQEFFRAENARESGIVGTGLGLATVKSLIDNFGGDLNVESTVGSGTTFTVSLSQI